MSHALRFGKYVSVALLAAGSDWLLFSLMVSLLHAPDLVSLMSARVLGGLVSFLSNRHWTWEGNRHVALNQQGRRFMILYVFSYAVSVGCFSGLTGLLAVPAYPAKLATDGICFLLNFMVMQAYVFHQRGGLVARLRRLLAGEARP